ncbi:protein FAM83B [Rhinatrema bivittatum]|uniref:protein FAM83B n=1 Tax=Rhinatrema bivittatum TaxID=194408 RepID=UPI00112987EF|nr:protein FAM83B [Rhinatrema bivittatum]
MESLSLLSSLHDECKSENQIEPHYKEWYRVAIDALIEGGITAYQEFLNTEQVTEFLAEEELSYIVSNVQKIPENTEYRCNESSDDGSSSGTYWPIESDVEAPNLDLGWPHSMPGHSGGTHIDLYFHPPRGHPYTIKETVRKMIKEARQVIAIVMDMFTDVDIFKELMEASTRGVPVYLLLDDFNFNHFFKMTEKQGIQVQRLRNIRVRTVKGQDYFSKSGAKFCGKMEQKFLLVDCQKVMFGTYSFMWSFEKVNLSMVQVISGQLVESFDEEFRTLYARSSIPSMFGQDELVIGKNRKIPWENGTYQHSLTSLISISSQRSLFDRQDKLHNLDSTYLKSRARFGINEEDRYSTKNVSYKPHLLSGFNMQNKIHQFQSSEKNEHWKRHSYAAGDKPDASPYLMLSRAINQRTNNNPSNNWKMQPSNPSVGSSSRGGYSAVYNGSNQNFTNRFVQQHVTNLGERNSNVRRSFHGTDNHIRSLQQKMPTLERTTKSFLRNWRIESYLNDHSDFPVDSSGEVSDDRYETYEGSESARVNPLYAHSRLRSSLMFKPTLSEQKEAMSCATGSTNSTIVDSQGSLTPKAITPKESSSSRFTSDKYVVPGYGGHQFQPEVMKRHSLQIPEGPRPVLNYNTNPETTSYLYTSLCANRQTDNFKSQQNESILKRRSLPLYEHSKVTIDYSANKQPSSYIYSTLGRSSLRQTANSSAKQDDLKFSNMHNHITMVDQSNQRESQIVTAERTTSNESLDDGNREDPNKDWSSKKDGKGSPNFLKKGSKKLRSLLNLSPDKKENLSKHKTSAFYRMCSSSDTLISEEEEKQSPKKPGSKHDGSPKKEKTVLGVSQISLNKSKENVCVSPAKSVKSTTDEGSKGPTVCNIESIGDSSTPRFNTEQIQYQDTKETITNAGYGTPLPSAALQRGMPQREVSQREMLQREMPHRGMLQRGMPIRDIPQREMHTATKPESPTVKENLTRSQTSERRIYSRFEPFCKLEGNTQATSNMQNSNLQPLELKNRTLGHNFVRPNHLLSYNSSVYHSLQPNENRLGRFMQKFGNFIHKTNK